MGRLIPPSLGNFPETKTPLYLALTRQDTSVLGKWKNIRLNDISGDVYVLPAPKTGLGLGTHSANLDEARFWQTSSVGDKARMIFGDTLYYAVGGLIGDVFNDKGQAEDSTGAIFGGSNIPKDLSNLQYKGMKKRAYSFSFELFAFTNNDFNAITQFCRDMHSYSMPLRTATGLSTPSVFRINIVNSGGRDVTNNWLFQPQPCMMAAFNSSALDYISIDANYTSPARVGVNMVLIEIEPVVNVNGNVQTVGQAFGSN